MAGDWLKIESHTPDKPEVSGIADILGIPPCHAFGALFVIWRWFDQQTVDGNAPYVTKTTVDRISGVPGFANAMEKVGWLDASDGSLRLPNFHRHNGETAKQRALTAKRVAKSKGKSNAINNAVGNGEVTHGALPREEKSKPISSSLRSEEIPPKPKSQKVKFTVWLESLKATGEKAISDYKPVLNHAAAVGIPLEWIELAWLKFRERYTNDPTYTPSKYIDWRRHFLNAVTNNWMNIWYLTDGKPMLTTVGQQAMLAQRNAA